MCYFTFVFPIVPSPACLHDIIHATIPPLPPSLLLLPSFPFCTHALMPVFLLLLLMPALCLPFETFYYVLFIIWSLVTLLFPFPSCNLISFPFLMPATCLPFPYLVLLVMEEGGRKEGTDQGRQGEGETVPLLSVVLVLAGHGMSQVDCPMPAACQVLPCWDLYLPAPFILPALTCACHHYTLFCATLCLITQRVLPSGLCHLCTTYSSLTLPHLPALPAPVCLCSVPGTFGRLGQWWWAHCALCLVWMLLCWPLTLTCACPSLVLPFP